MSKRIKGITIEIDGETKGLDKALSDVTRRSRDVNKELNQIERALKFNPGNTELIAQKQKLLGEQVDITRERLDRLKSAESEVQAEFNKGNIAEDKYRAFQREIIETESRLKHYEGQLESTASKTQELADKTAEAGDKFSSAGDKLSSAGRDMSTKVTAPLVGVAGIAAKVGMDFEASMSKVAATSGATAKEIDDLTNKAREMGKSTKFSASESAEAMNYMALAGWDTRQIMAGIEPTLNLAAASGMDLARASDIVTDAMSMFGLEAEEAGKVTDTLAATASSANTDVDQLGEAFKYVGANSSAAGMDIEKTAAFLGILGDNGLKGSVAGTTLNAILRDLKAKAEDGALAVGEQSVALYDSEGQMRDMTDVMDDLINATVDMTDEQRDQAVSSILGQEALKGFNVYANEGAGAIGELEDKLRGSSGAASEMSAIMQDNLAGRLSELKSALEEVAIVIFDIIQPALESMVGWLTTAAEWFQELPSSMQSLIVTLGVVAAAIGPILIVLGMFASSIGSILTLVSTIIPMLGGLGTVFAALSAPLLILIAKIVAVVAAVALVVTLVIKYWDDIKEATLATWGFISDFFKTVWEGIGSVFESVLGFISNLISTVWDSVKDTVYSVWDGIAQYLTNILDIIKNILVGAFLVIVQVLTGQWNEALNTTIQVFGNIKDAIVGNITIIKDTIVAILSFIYDFIKNVFSWIYDTSTSSISSMVKVIVDSIVGLPSTFRDIFDSIIRFITSIDFMQIGKDIIGGLIKGVSSMAESLIKSVTGVVDSAITGAKKLLGIKSPSRVFMEIGEFTGEGLARGLLSMGDRVQRASDSMVSGTIVSTDDNIVTSDDKPRTGSDGSQHQGSGDIIIHIDSMTVTDEDDIQRISRALKELIDRERRGRGDG